eukprot:6395905-Prymnesium_polylepis.1
MARRPMQHRPHALLRPRVEVRGTRHHAVAHVVRLQIGVRRQGVRQRAIENTLVEGPASLCRVAQVPV